MSLDKSSIDDKQIVTHSRLRSPSELSVHLSPLSVCLSVCLSVGQSVLVGWSVCMPACLPLNS